jgi:site-specific recombinase XerD
MDEPQRFPQAFAEYDQILLASRNLAPRTRQEYKRDLTHLIAFLADHCSIDHPHQVTRHQLERYLAHLDHHGFAGATRRRRLAAIRSFFGYLADAGTIKQDPSKKLRTPAREYHEPRVLTEGEYKRLLEVVRYEPRDGALVELLLQTGMRLAELSGLALQDLELPSRIRADGEVGAIHIYGKGRRERTVTLNYKACKAVKAYLGVRPKVVDQHLFLSKFKRGMGPRAIQRVIEKHLKEAEIPAAAVHTLRHTFATHHVKKGTNLRVVQEALGHASLATTGVYVHLARELMDRQLQQNAL